MSYVAPVKDIKFVMQELAGLEAINKLPGCEEATLETVEAILEEDARFCGEVVAPLNRSGDLEHSVRQPDGSVKTPKGFKEAFKQFGAGGWQGLHFPTEFGGQGLPKLVATAAIEMINSANLSFALCPLLTDGAVEAILLTGTEAQRNTYLPKLISGEWTGTMNLTEPQAGSDLALVKSRAVPQADGSFRVFGQKIFITFGEHDMADNIIHLVLARTPSAPEGVKGISLFIVPKFVVNADGTPGKRNDVYCASLEHKLGINASPTAVLLYGDNKGEVGEGAIGYLIGEENRGLEYMFIMMNAARFAVGMQGIAVAERAYQKAVAYAKDRTQSRAVEGSSGPVTIIHHPDVRRMLMTMRAYTEGARASAYVTAAALDAAHHHPDATVRAENQSFYEYMVPLVKGFSTEMSLEVTSLGVQVHGGMGFIEETGAAQYYRDARILTIYEGTTAIQANDLVGRKTARDAGKTAKGIIAQIRKTESELAQFEHGDLAVIRNQLAAASKAFEEVVDFVVANAKADIRAVYAGSVPYLKLAGITVAGWNMARAALAAQAKIAAGDSDPFYATKVVTARFYADHILTLAPALRSAIVGGAEGALALELDQF
ncbi:MAG: acyl-CoA dehydrogenase [Betaproteobacteria bacterium]|nr:acyl-CoA dehydrogenase [Betaproteobacteria bacterium]